MQEKSTLKKEQRAFARIVVVRSTIAEFDHVCSGTIVKSMLTCGKPNCRCATDPAHRHGPYYQWNRMKKGKLLHSTITENQAFILQRAINNYRRIKKLLKNWEEETRKVAGVK